LARRIEGGVTGGEPLAPGQALSEIRQLIRNQHQLRVNPGAKLPNQPADPFLEEDPEEIDQETSQLLAQIVRKEMLDQKHGNWFQRLTRHPAFVIPAFILCIGSLVYLLWPMSPDEEVDVSNFVTVAYKRLTNEHGHEWNLPKRQDELSCWDTDRKQEPFGQGFLALCHLDSPSTPCPCRDHRFS